MSLPLNECEDAIVCMIPMALSDDLPRIDRFTFLLNASTNCNWTRTPVFLTYGGISAASLRPLCWGAPPLLLSCCMIAYSMPIAMSSDITSSAVLDSMLLTNPLLFSSSFVSLRSSMSALTVSIVPVLECASLSFWSVICISADLRAMRAHVWASTPNFVLVCFLPSACASSHASPCGFVLNCMSSSAHAVRKSDIHSSAIDTSVWTFVMFLVVCIVVHAMFS